MRGEDGKYRGNICFSGCWWDVLVIASRCYWKQQESGKEVECANRTSHIARPCPSAAGDYVDYRMIRTPPAPPSLPPWCYTGPEVEGSEIWRKTSCVLAEKRGHFSVKPWSTGLTLPQINAQVNKEACHEMDAQASRLYIRRSWDWWIWGQSGANNTLLPPSAFIGFIQSHNVRALQREGRML